MGNGTQFACEFAYLVGRGFHNQADHGTSSVTVGNTGSGDNQVTVAGEQIVHLNCLPVPLFHYYAYETQSFIQREHLPSESETRAAGHGQSKQVITAPDQALLRPYLSSGNL